MHKEKETCGCGAYGKDLRVMVRAIDRGKVIQLLYLGPESKTDESLNTGRHVIGHERHRSGRATNNTVCVRKHYTSSV